MHDIGTARTYYRMAVDRARRAGQDLLSAYMLEVATAVRQGGELDRDASQVDEAFRLGSDALKIGIRYTSERVVQRARRFRRDYRGPQTARVREFDRHLRSTLI